MIYRCFHYQYVESYAILYLKMGLISYLKIVPPLYPPTHFQHLGSTMNKFKAFKMSVPLLISQY